MVVFCLVTRHEYQGDKGDMLNATLHLSHELAEKEVREDYGDLLGRVVFDDEKWHELDAQLAKIKIKYAWRIMQVMVPEGVP